ncbi:MAG: hypothetical protein JO001_06500 [Alphaproteobacteria bacterium]|nr:hypothetical protein [Alphaproteobacteria bacterium]
MQVPELRSTNPLQIAGYGQSGPAPAGKERLAIIAPGGKLCGISAYATAMRRQLKDAFEITIFDLDQYLLRSVNRRVRRLGDRHIREICTELGGFDAVNLQLEHGTLGLSSEDICRRFGWLTDAAPRLSVTFHSLPRAGGFDVGGICRALLRGRFAEADRLHSAARRDRRLSFGIAKQLRRVQRRKQLTVIVHNRRDLSDMRFMYGIDRVFDHPLAFLSAEEVAVVRGTTRRGDFPILDETPGDAVLIGVFGFLNEYKGIATAIRALHHLPAQHHLLIFGGLHPQEIPRRQQRHPYISSLFDEAFVDTSLYQRLGEREANGHPQFVLSEAGWREIVAQHPRDLSSRIHFMGVHDEREFLRGMAICDAVVFPYLEVGQSSSGPISQALEMGCRVIASRTLTFLGFADYHPDSVEFFDIGNHLELAERLATRRQFAPRAGLPEINIETNKATYIMANSRIAGANWSGARRHSLVRTRDEEPALI